MTHLPPNTALEAPQWGAGAGGKSAIAASFQVPAMGSYLAVVNESVAAEVTPPPAYKTPAPGMAFAKLTEAGKLATGAHVSVETVYASTVLVWFVPLPVVSPQMR